MTRKTRFPVAPVRAPRPRQQKGSPRGANRGQRAAIVLIGPPGSGKTTLARALVERAPMSIIEVGNLIKGEIQRGTQLGKAMKPFASSGNLVPVTQVREIVSAALQKATTDIVLFDGIPRAIDQIRPFLDLLTENDLRLHAIIILTIDLRTVLDRLAGRRVCRRCGALYNLPASSGRPLNVCERCGGKLARRQDDSERVARARFKRFEKETLPVIEFFKKEFGELTWEQSAARPQAERADRVWRRLQQNIR